jgi:hypothetical protein
MSGNRAVFPAYAKLEGDRAAIKLLTLSVMIARDMESLNQCPARQILDVYKDYLQ